MSGIYSRVTRRLMRLFSGVPRLLRGLPVLAALLLVLATPASASSVAVSIEGLEGEEKANALIYLEISRLSGRDDLGELVVRLLHRKAPKNLRAALRPFGYYDVQVESELSPAKDGWSARYLVTRGNRVKVRNSSVELVGVGVTDPVFSPFVSRGRLMQGEGLRQDHYDQLKRDLLGVALGHGYFEARFVAQQLAVYPDLLAADIELRLETGPRYAFGSIGIEQRVLDERFVRRYLEFKPGDPFDSARLLDLQYALYDSEYFSYVEANSGEPDRETLSVPVTITAEAGKRQRYRFGIGYGTDTEARVSASWENRRINRRGHKLLLDTRLSPIKQEIGGRYMLPLSVPTRERLSFTGTLSRETLADTRSRRIELGVVHTTLRKNWERSTYLRALRETTSDGLTEDTETLLRPGVIWTRSKADQPIFPRRGSRISAEISGSHSALGSDVDFIQLHLQGRLIRPLGRRSRLLARAEFGGTSIGVNEVLPASLRFFAGGDQSVRGFGLNTLGPVDENGLVIGGRYLVTGSLEFEQMLSERWGIAVFADGGNALQDLGDPLEYSAGAGLRWRSPVGMFRLDVARPLSEPGAGLRLHVGIGAEL